MSKTVDLAVVTDERPLLKIAVPNKGSLAEPAAQMLREAGYRQRWDPKDLVLTDEINEVEFYYLRPRDIAVYVGEGTLDIGITGRDMLLDSESSAADVVETGSTLRKAGLEVFGDPILVSEAILIRRRGGDEPAGMQQLVRRLSGVIVARDYVLIDYDIDNVLLDKGIALTPDRRRTSCCMPAGSS